MLKQSILIAALLAAIPGAVASKPASVPHARLFKLLSTIQSANVVFTLRYQPKTDNYKVESSVENVEHFSELSQLLEAVIADKAFWQDQQYITDDYSTTTFLIGDIAFSRVRCEAEHDKFNWTVRRITTESSQENTDVLTWRG